MNARAIIRGMVPGRRWLALAVAVALAAGVATPLLAQQVTITSWTLPVTQVYDIALDSSDNVWAQTNGTSGIHRLDLATDELTTYTTGFSQHSAVAVAGVGGADEAWSPGTISAVPGTVEVLSKLDLVTLELTSWPLGFQGENVLLDSQGNVWTARGTKVGWLQPGTNTVTTWTLPVNVALSTFDSSGRLWFRYDDQNVGGSESGLARLDPATNTLTTWPVATDPDSVNAPFVDGSGNVWAALFHSVGEDAIIRLNPATNTITEWPCRPGCDGLVDVTVDATGKVWFTMDWSSWDFSAIVRLDPAADPPVFTEWSFNCWELGVACGGQMNPLPRALLVDSTGNFWMRFAHPNVDQIGRLTP